MRFSASSRAVRNNTGDDRSGIAQATTDLEASETGQHHVQHDQIHRSGAGQREPLHPVIALGDGVAPEAERGRDDVGDGAVVLDHQDPWRSCRTRAA